MFRVNRPAYGLECPLPFMLTTGIRQYGYYVVHDILSKVDLPDQKKKMPSDMGTRSVPLTVSEQGACVACPF